MEIRAALVAAVAVAESVMLRYQLSTHQRCGVRYRFVSPLQQKRGVGLHFEK
jgi:hypothetical protein